MAKLIQVIETQTRRGTGTDGTAVREVTEYWSPEGRLLAEQDPCGPLYDPTDGTWIMPAWAKTKVGSPVAERMLREQNA